MDKLMRKLLQLEAFEIRTLIIQYYLEHCRWPESFAVLVNDTEYNSVDSLHQSKWTFTVAAAEGPTSYWAITVEHDSGIKRTFCVDLPLFNQIGAPLAS